MATITPTTKNGQDLIAKLSQGTFIDFLDAGYGIAESPDSTQGVVKPWGNDALNTFEAFGYIDYDDMASDELAWFETGRIHKAYKGNVTKATNVLTFPAGHDIREDDVIEVADADNRAVANVISISGNDVTVTWKLVTSGISDGAVSVMHQSREVQKGSEATTDFLHREYDRFSNQPVIIRDGLKYTRSDLAQIVQFLPGNDALWTMDYTDLETRFQNAQIVAALYGRASEATSTSEGANLEGMTSLEEAVNARGNNIQGGLSSYADIEAYERMLTANKSPMNHMLLQDVEYSQKLNQALAELNRHEASSFNFGNFNNMGDKMVDLGFSGFKTPASGFTVGYKPLDILDDEIYYGALDTAVKPHGFSIPVGSTPDGEGGHIPYFSMVYRSNARRNVYKTGGVFNDGVGDYGQIDLVTEFTTRHASMKDFSTFNA